MEKRRSRTSVKEAMGTTLDEEPPPASVDETEPWSDWVRAEKIRLEEEGKEGISLDEEMPSPQEGKNPELAVPPDVVRHKYIPLERMTEAEAANKLEELDHAFLLFLNTDDGSPQVIYKRRSARTSSRKRKRNKIFLKIPISLFVQGWRIRSSHSQVMANTFARSFSKLRTFMNP